jgi:multidrug efflux pump subunit AcrA (membrane-fusion protein)
MKERETEAIRPPTLTRRRRRLPRFSRLTVVVIVLLLIGIGFWRLLSKPGSAQPPNPTESKTVAVVKVVRNTLKTDSTLQAEFIPYQDILVHAKISGYVSMIRVDIGDRVKQGELLATLEVPELQDNINKAYPRRSRKLPGLKRTMTTCTKFTSGWTTWSRHTLI